MVKHFLITTALEETWHDDEHVLFLGEWCKTYSRKDYWSRMDAEVLAYHWDDRAKLFNDYQYLQDFHERLLQNLTIQLNQAHSVNHSLRYWRILIGPWLGNFVQMLFDRWTSIQQAVSQYELSSTIILTGYEEAMVPNDMNDFIRLYAGDEWNHHIYSSILEKFTSVTCIKQARQNMKGFKRPISKTGWRCWTKRNLIECYCRIMRSLSSEFDAFLLTTYLPFREEIGLYRRLKQLPQRWNSVSPEQVAVDETQRRWIVKGENLLEFEAFASTIIPQQIPTAYLEGYGQLVKKANDLPWPKTPKLIFTSNSFASDDIFKAWAADKVEYGTPLIIGQHGGHYGVGRWSFIENHEIAISDCFLSWGWADPEEPKVKPVGQLTATRPLGVRHAENREALLVTCAVPKYSYYMYSIIVSRQYLDYFGDQCEFVAALPNNIRRNLTVRLHSEDFGWKQVLRWHDRFPTIRLDVGRTNIKDLIRKSRLFIATYNATTFLESFSMNVPTVIYWNTNHWELRDSAIPYFNELKRVGIFHETADSAARHVATIWENVDSWWSSNEVQVVLKRFKLNYCNLPNNLIDRLESSFQEVMSDRNSLRLKDLKTR